MLKRVVICSAALLAVLVAGTVPAQGHTASNFFDGKYGNTEDVYVHIVTTGNWWNQDRRDRLQDALDEWNFAPGLGPIFHMSNDWGSELSCGQTNNDIQVHRVELPTVYGYTQQCQNSGGMYGAILQIDSTPSNGNRTWFDNGCGGAYDGANAVSLCGVLTHEMGHAGGWDNHFSITDDPCDNFDWTLINTMCGGEKWTAEEWWRASGLESHDKHTWDNEY